MQKYFHPESTDPTSFQKLVVFFLAFLVIDFVSVDDCVSAGASRPGDPGRCLAAYAGMAAAFRLPATLLDRIVQDAEACGGRAEVCLGQIGEERQL